MGKPIITKKIFLESFEKLEIAFRTKLNDKELDVYYAHLKSLPADVLSNRINDLILSNKFFPRVSEIWNGYIIERSESEILAKYGIGVKK